MAKDIVKKQDAIIVIPDSVKKNLPRDFDIGDIGKIDLSEAESIANEDIFLIKENELIVGLEDFDLIPLKETTAPRAEGVSKKEFVEEAPSEEIPPVAASTKEESRRMDTDEVLVHPRKDDAFDDGRNWISLEELENYDEHGRKWIPIEEVLGKDEHGGPAVPVTTAEKEPEDLKRDLMAERESFIGKRDDIKRAGEKPEMVEGFVEIDDEYVIWDIPAKAEQTEKKPALKQEQKLELQPAVKPVDTERSTIVAVEKDDEVVISMEDLTAVPVLKATGAESVARLGTQDTREQKIAAEDKKLPTIGATNLMTEGYPSPYSEMLVPSASAEGAETGTVYFIDDRAIQSEDEGKTIFNETELDKIISGIVQVDEGAAYMLREADVNEDRDRIALISDEFGTSHEDLFVDLEYKYSDEELDYIHTAIVEEDYGSYIQEIDEFFGSPGGRTIPAAVELLGLTADEFDTIEDVLFQDEFKDIHLYDRYHLYEFDRASREGIARDRKNCRYLLPEADSLMDSERDSIESDVSSSSALVFEEDIHEISAQLARRTGKTDAEIHALFERAASLDIPAARNVDAGTAAGPAPVEKTKVIDSDKSPADKITDITDRVVILDDKDDVERFVKEFPASKQTNVKMLLKYLDGLFETLPEEIIKKFASSEYFDLYLKVLNELGV